MYSDFRVNQAAWLLSALKPIAQRQICGALADMVEDSMELDEFNGDPIIMKSLISNLRTACESND